AAAIGAVIGVPSLRIKGLYLAIATLAAQLIIEWTINHVPWISGGVQASIEVPRSRLFGHALVSQTQLYLFLLFFAALAIIATVTLARSRIDRAFIAIRDYDIAPEPHRRRRLPLQADRVRDLVVLRRPHWGPLHLLSRRRQLRAIPDQRPDRLPGHDHHRRARRCAGLHPLRSFSHPVAHFHPPAPPRICHPLS